MTAAKSAVRPAQPGEDDLRKMLGSTTACFEALRTHLKDQVGAVMEEWKYYGEKHGWALKFLHKKRNLFFFTPFPGAFRIGFVFGERAVAAILESDLPSDLIATVKSSRKYAEGRGLAVVVKDAGDLEVVKKLVAIKIAF